MKKSELRQLIKEEYSKILQKKPTKSLKEQEDDFEDDEMDSDEPWTEQDGWNVEYFEDKGLMDVLDIAGKIDYEINNARRGTYGISGNTLDSLINELQELVENLTMVIEDLEGDL